MEINFYKNTSIKNESDFSELIKNKLYVTFELGSSKKKVDLQLYFSSDIIDSYCACRSKFGSDKITGLLPFSKV